MQQPWRADDASLLYVSLLELAHHTEWNESRQRMHI